MAKVTHGNVKGPNQEGPKGNLLNSSGPMGHSASKVKGSNEQSAAGSHLNSCGPMGKSHGNVKGSNDRSKFDIADATAGYFDPVSEPGKGSIPVNPFSQGGSPMSAAVMRDSAKK